MTRFGIILGVLPLLLLVSVALPGVCAAAGPPSGAAAVRPGVLMHLATPDGKELAAPVPLTFGAVFRQGEIAAGKAVAATLNGQAVAVQFDAKRHYADGSVKHGVVSMILPPLAAEGAALQFFPVEGGAPQASAAADAAAKLLAGDFDAVVSCKVPEGRTVTAGARRLLEAAGGKGRLWLDGPTAVEWLLAGPPVDGEGNPDPDLNVQFQVRHYPATGDTRVSAAVEICSDGGSDGGLIYDVAVTRGRAKPEVVFEQKALRQPDLTRWRRVFWMGDEPAAVVIRHDATAMAAAGVIPMYDFTLQVPEPTLADQWRRWQASRRGLFENGFICEYMGTTGGRADIGPLPTWTVLYLLSMDPRQKQAMLGNGELGAGIPTHGRVRATGRVPVWEDNKMLWLADGRAGNWGTTKFRPKPAPPRVEQPVKSAFSPDAAHVPSLAYMPYVVTGDYYLLEETYFWASYIIFHTNPGYAKGLAWDGQLRGKAWSLRTVMYAAAIAPDGDPERRHFSRCVVDTLNAYVAESKTPQAMPLGMLGTVPADAKKLNYAPWQHDYLTMVVDCTVNAGFPEAEPLRRMLLDFSLGRFTHAPDFDPRHGCGYWWDIVDAARGVKVATWKDLFDANCAGREPFWGDNPGSYCDLALAAASVAVRTGHPDAKKVHDYLLDRCPNIMKSRPANPTFAFSTAPVR